MADIAAEPTFPGADAVREYDLASDRMLSVWSDEAVADRTYAMPWGDTPGLALLGFMLIEQVTHGWDIAMATGQDPSFDPDVVDAALDLAHEYDDESIRVPGMFAPIVPVDGGRNGDRPTGRLSRS